MGSDAYRHLFYTKVMYEANSLSDFYDTMAEYSANPDWEYNRYYYPFGLWLFTAEVSHITGISPYTIGVFLPILILVITILAYYLYAKTILNSEEEGLFSVILFLTMPIAIIPLLHFRPMTAVLPLLLLIFYFMVTKNNNIKGIVFKIVFVNLLLFFICVTHGGTYIFLMTFSIAYLLLFSLLWGKTEINAWILTISALLIYMVTMQAFPEIFPNYASDLRWIPNIFDSLLSQDIFITTYINAGIHEIYEGIFLKFELMYAMLLFFILGVLSLFSILLNSFLKKEFLKFKEKKYPGFLGLISLLPLQINLNTFLSHGIGSMPFWLGPFHLIFSLFAFRSINRRAIAILLAIAIICVPPALMSSGESGAMRFMFYFILIIPIFGARGISEILMKTMNRYLNKPYSMLVVSGLFLIFATLVVSPLLGNMYYSPKIATDHYEIDGMKWLSNQHKDKESEKDYEVCVAYGYDLTVDLYTNKHNPESFIESGGYYRDYMRSVLDTYASRALGEKRIVDLSSIGIDYLILSDKTSKQVEDENLSTELQTVTQAVVKNLDSNKHIDRVYAAKESDKEPFIIYSTNLRGLINTGKGRTSEYYQIENEDYDYVMRIEKEQPRIFFLGKDIKSPNLLVSAGIYPAVSLIYYDKDNNWTKIIKEYSITNLSFKSSIIDYNKIIYTANISREKNTMDNKITYNQINITFTFYPMYFEQEIVMEIDEEEIDKDSLGVCFMQTMFMDNFTHIRANTYPDEFDRDIEFNNEMMVNTGSYDYISLVKNEEYVKNDINEFNEFNIKFEDYQDQDTLLYRGLDEYDYTTIISKRCRGFREPDFTKLKDFNKMKILYTFYNYSDLELPEIKYEPADVKQAYRNLTYIDSNINLDYINIASVNFSNNKSVFYRTEGYASNLSFITNGTLTIGVGKSKDHRSIQLQGLYPIPISNVSFKFKIDTDEDVVFYPVIGSAKFRISYYNKTDRDRVYLFVYNTTTNTDQVGGYGYFKHDWHTVNIGFNTTAKEFDIQIDDITLNNLPYYDKYYSEGLPAMGEPWKFDLNFPASEKEFNLTVLYINQTIPKKLITPSMGKIIGLGFDGYGDHVLEHAKPIIEKYDKNGAATELPSPKYTSENMWDAYRIMDADGWDIDLHTTHRLTYLNTTAAFDHIDEEIMEVWEKIGKKPTSIIALGGQQNYTHIKYAYDKYGTLCRFTSNSHTYGASYQFNMYEAFDTSTHLGSLFSTANVINIYTHKVYPDGDPDLNPTHDISISTFDKYLNLAYNRSMRIRPFTEMWRTADNQLDATYTNINFTNTSYKFTSHTNGYDAY
ncbi:MAG: hypothetical protein CVT90_00125, partial [Candidatus Altiarchaeales archaeon HGW-Altiarchaeales-3]